jgi:hypothetical protein
MRESENALAESATQNLAKISKRFKTNEKKIADVEAKAASIQQVGAKLDGRMRKWTEWLEHAFAHACAGGGGA